MGRLVRTELTPHTHNRTGEHDELRFAPFQQIPLQRTRRLLWEAGEARATANSWISCMAPPGRDQLSSDSRKRPAGIPSAAPTPQSRMRAGTSPIEPPQCRTTGKTGCRMP